MYYELFKDIRSQVEIILEVGIGTNSQDCPSAMGAFHCPGASQKAFAEFFLNPRLNVIGADIDPRSFYEYPGVSTGYINQLNPQSIYNFLAVNAPGGLDVLIDDGLHTVEGNYTLLLSSWSFLRANGLYIIEDIEYPAFSELISRLEKLALKASGWALELPAEKKTDNRMIVLQKN